MKRTITILLLLSFLVACNAPVASPEALAESATSIPETPIPATLEPAAIDAPLVQSPELIKIQFLTPRDGWGVTATQIVRTNDGGVTWYDVTPPELGEAGYDVDWFIMDNDHVWLQLADNANYPNAGFQYRTTDGGVTWNEIDTPYSGAHISFVDPNDGWALADLGIGAGSNAVAVYQTTDGGATWIQKFTNDPNRPSSSDSIPLSGLKFGLTPLNMQTAWVYGVVYASGSPYIFRTDDGGATWSPVTLTLPEGGADAELSVEEVSFANENTIFLVMRNTANATSTSIYISTDSGHTWSLTPTSIPDGGFVSFISPSELVFYNRAQFYVTRDAAKTWSIIPPEIKFGDSFSGMDFVNADTGYVLSLNSDTNHTSLYRTDDGGATWFPVIP
ncbi:MAG: hypothetical protein U0V48_08680 [Anaerolineales bacterium]